jgi:hypothetical protein
MHVDYLRLINVFTCMRAHAVFVRDLCTLWIIKYINCMLSCYGNLTWIIHEITNETIQCLMANFIRQGINF